MRLQERALEALNRWFLSRVGGESRPVFHDVGEVCPALLELDRHFEEIREEVAGVLSRRVSMPTYDDEELRTRPIRMAKKTGGERGWGVMYLAMMGYKPEAFRRAFARTSELVDRIPNVFAAQVSYLAPGHSIPEHSASYAGYLRYHLGVIVPRERTPVLRIRDERYIWREGESVLFDDAWAHEVINECSEPRVVLMVDVLRPIGGIADRVNRFVTRQIVRRALVPKVMAAIGPEWEVGTAGEGSGAERSSEVAPHGVGV